ncbi:MAG: Cof-type HAD-IIB family hydrolase [Bacteroidales bacterium]|nr:Cof-type HAD-IIB family hydrolase [Bacteroidales bacterium]
MYKLLVLDIDGTLTDSTKKISRTTKRALRRAQNKGVKIVLASGRPTPGIVPVAEELGFAEHGGYILSFNGGKIIDYKTGKTIFESVLPGEMIPMLYEDSRANNVSIISYDATSVLTETPEDQYIIKEAKLNKMPITKVNSFIDAVQHPVTKCLMTGDAEHLAEVEQREKDKYGATLSIYRSEPFFLEIMPKGIDKAQSLQRLLDHLGLTKNEMIACGDGFNDLSMIKFAGLGVAMSNAQKIVKRNADYITFTNDENGVAHVVDKYILGKKKQRQLEWKKNLRLSNITAKLYKYTHRLQHK